MFGFLPRFCPWRIAQTRGWRQALRASVWLAVCFLACWGAPARAESIALRHFELSQGDEGLALSFATQFELSKSVDDALQKGLPLIFVAEAQVYRKRWYWADKQISSTTRQWRLAYQPLTRQYRVTFAGISRSHDRLADALASLNSASGWKLAERAQLDDGTHYVEFSYRLDTTQLPRPMQMSVDGQSEWQLRVERMQRLK